MRLVVEIKSGTTRGRNLVVHPGETKTVGRGLDADLQAPHDSEISRSHFEVECTGEACYLRDLQSANGTYLNGKQIDIVQIRNGDEIQVGQTTLAVTIETSATPPEPDPDNHRPEGEPDASPASEYQESATVFAAEDSALMAAAERLRKPKKAAPLLRVLRNDTGKLYALLDAARTPRIIELLAESGERFQSLYEGEKGRELAAVAPYLAELPDDSFLFSQLVREGWGQSWGVFIRTDCDFSELRKHFRHFLLVKLEDGPDVYFRFYDPRVLRTYLPTCTIGETKQFFGPVFSYLMESKDSGALLRFEPGGSADYPEEIPVQYEDR